MWTLIPGVVIVVFTLREVFLDLFHPSGTGTLSDWVARTIFSLFRRWRSLLPAAGPLAVIVIILLWVVLIVVGFGLIYLPFLPSDFLVKTGHDPRQEHGFWPAAYLSFEMITNLGLGDFTPKGPVIRLLVTLHALIGYGLITASVSWIVLLYPALGRLRSLARNATIMAEAEQRCGIEVVDEGAEDLLHSLAEDLVTARIDFVYFPVIYYFFAADPRACLATALPHLVRFADSGLKTPDAPRVHLAAAHLRAALDDLAEILAHRFIDRNPKDPEAVFRAYAEQHRVI